MVTVGVAAGSVGRVPDLAAPHPENVSRSGKSNIVAKGEETLERSLCGRIFIAVFLLTGNRI
jgi:hypothetical protein